MFCIETDHIPEKYVDILSMVLQSGRQVAPRGQKCLEISPLCVTARSPRKRLFGTPGRDENPLFAYIEGLWMLKGEDTPEMPAHYVRQTLSYVNKQTGRFDGAYGPRLRNDSGIDQFDEVFRKLSADPESRRAVITLFDAVKDCDEESLDIPCTIAIQFLLREESLDAITFMRSNDLFRGFVYDTVEFQWFQEILAGWLGVEVGRYVHFVGSAHVYLKDLPRVNRILLKHVASAPCPTLYRDSLPQDARLSKRDFESEIVALAEIEELSRTGQLLDYRDVEVISRPLTSPFYRNLALAIIGYNAQKFGNRRMEAAVFAQIDNDLGALIRRTRSDAPAGSHELYAEAGS